MNGVKYKPSWIKRKMVDTLGNKPKELDEELDKTEGVEKGMSQKQKEAVAKLNTLKEEAAEALANSFAPVYTKSSKERAGMSHVSPKAKNKFSKVRNAANQLANLKKENIGLS